MVKSRRGCERILVMAVGTGVPKGTLVKIGMAAQAILFEPEKSSSRSFGGRPFDEFRLMATRA